MSTTIANVAQKLLLPHRDPLIIHIYQLVMYLELGVSFILYPLVVYTIFRKSPPEMELFPWFLVLNLTANYAFCFLLAIWQVKITIEGTHPCFGRLFSETVSDADERPRRNAENRI